MARKRGTKRKWIGGAEAKPRSFSVSGKSAKIHSRDKKYESEAPAATTIIRRCGGDGNPGRGRDLEPLFVVFIGPPGSGKSWCFKRVTGKEARHLSADNKNMRRLAPVFGELRNYGRIMLLDKDEIRTLFAGYMEQHCKDTEGRSREVCERKAADLMIEEAIGHAVGPEGSKPNIGYLGTGKNPEKMYTRLRPAVEAGYKIVLVRVECSRAAAWTRVDARAKEDPNKLTKKRFNELYDGVENKRGELEKLIVDSFNNRRARGKNDPAPEFIYVDNCGSDVDGNLLACAVREAAASQFKVIEHTPRRLENSPSFKFLVPNKSESAEGWKALKTRFNAGEVTQEVVAARKKLVWNKLASTAKRGATLHNLIVSEVGDNIRVEEVEVVPVEDRLIKRRTEVGHAVTTVVATGLVEPSADQGGGQRARRTLKRRRRRRRRKKRRRTKRRKRRKHKRTRKKTRRRAKKRTRKRRRH